MNNNYLNNLIFEKNGVIFIKDIYDFSDGEKVLEKIFKITEKNITQEEYDKRVSCMYDSGYIPLEIRYQITDDESCDNYCTPCSYRMDVSIYRADTSEEITQYFDTEKIYEEFIKKDL